MPLTLLLDTHTLLWFLLGSTRLSPTAKSLIEDPSHRVLVSIATCWEIAIKVGLGKRTLGEPTRPYLTRAIALNQFDLLPITLEHATEVEGLHLHHKDPFDRMLIAQAIVEAIPILSVDSAFDVYSVQRAW